MIPQGGEVLSESLSLDLVDLGGKTFDFRLDPFVRYPRKARYIMRSFLWSF